MQVTLEAMKDQVIPLNSEKISLLSDELKTFRELFAKLTGAPFEDLSEEAHAETECVFPSPQKFKRSERSKYFLDVKSVAIILRSVCARMEPLFIKKKISFCFSIQENDTQEKENKAGVIALDKKTLERIFENLLSNEARYVPSRGKVSLIFRTTKISETAATPHIIFTIDDSGPGIAKKDVAQIFEEGFRAKEAVGVAPTGKGLGLTYVKNKVEEAGGTIRVSRTKTGGAAFAISLPLEKQPSP